jgi:hypothetical protein
MRKHGKRLSLHSESLLVLEAPELAVAGVATQTCPTSCAPTCGNPGALAHRAGIPKTAAACCV